MVTESDRLLADGVPIQLAAGEERLRFTFRALKQLEDHYGSLGEAADHLGTTLDGALKGLTGPVVSDLGVFLGAGLGVPADAALDLLPVENMRGTIVDAATACVGAWMQAFPAPRAEGNADEAVSNGSRGGTSTGSSPSPAAAPTVSSGG